MYHEIPPEMLALLEPVARDHGLEIVDAEAKRGPARTQVRVVVDTPAGDGRVSVETCAALHREIAQGLYASGLIPGEVALEVSSPGVDRVLGRAIDFERALGRTVDLETREALQGRRHFKGELVAFEAERALLRQDQEDVAIPLALIRRARALYPIQRPSAKR